MVVYKALNTHIESRTTNTRHAVGDGDGGKARAVIESSIVNTRHAVGDSDGGEANTARESRTTNTCHAVSDIIIIDSLWNYYTSLIFIGATCYLSSFGFGN